MVLENVHSSQTLPCICLPFPISTRTQKVAGGDNIAPDGRQLSQLRGEWPSGPASSISFTEVKHGCVRSETGWATFRMNDQNTAHSAVLRKGR